MKEEYTFKPEPEVEVTPWKFFIGLLCCFVAPFLLGLFYGSEIIMFTGKQLGF